MSNQIAIDLLRIVNRFEAALVQIAEMQPEKDEWDAVDKFADCRRLARAALEDIGIEYSKENKHESD